MKLDHLFSPIQINNTVFKNRIVVSAMVTNYCREDGMPTEKFMAYHEHKAKGGYGIIICEDFEILPHVGGFKRLPGLWEDRQIDPYHFFTDRIHRAGAKVIAQIYHAGRETTSAITGTQPVAPSPVKDPTIEETPRALETAEIKNLEDAFAACALRAKKAGFDGIEVHGAHGYLVGQFVSPFSNKRTDEYGGTILNRARFAVNIVRKIRETCGRDFIIFYRMSAQEYVDGGLGIEESKLLARLLEEAGVDCLHVSQGVYQTVRMVIPPHDIPLAGFIENAAQIKSVVHIPVIAAGRINDPLLAESILASGQADLCTMARASLADPEMPNKAMEGRYDEILHCIGCLQGCAGENSKGNCVRCLVNPMTGMEDEYQIEPVETPKNIIVVGGGISGCEAAIVAAFRGHHVTLLEASDELGGQWIAASIPTGKAEFASFLFWQKRMLDKYQVTVKKEVRVTKDVLQEYQPDAVILATGSRPAIPPIEGMKEYTVPAQDVLRGCRQVTGKTVVIGGGLVGAETADFIAAHGCEDVTIIEMLPEIASEGSPAPTWYLKKRLENNSVNILTSAKVYRVTDNTVVYRKGDSLYEIENVTSVINAVGARADRTLEQDLSDVSYTVVSVGDCHERASNGYRAIREGFEAGMRV